MAKTDYKTIDEYIMTFPENVQEKLEFIRQIIHEAVPDAKEVISYQIPCFNLGGPILYFSAFKKHLSIAAPPPTMEIFKDELTEYKTSVSVIKIPYDQPVPKDLITRMAQYRASVNAKKVSTN